MSVSKTKKKKPVKPKVGDPGIAKRLRETRHQAGLTQKEFAESMDVKLSHLKALELATYGVTIDFLHKWKDRYKKSYTWILEGD